MYNNLKIRSAWAQLALFMSALLGAYLVIGVVAAQVQLGLRGGGQAADLADPHVLVIYKILQAAWTIFLFGLPSFIYGRAAFREHPLRELGFRPAQNAGFYILAIVLLVMAVPLEGWLGALNKKIPLPSSLVDLERATDKQVTAYLKVRSQWDVVVNVVIMAFLPAIFEELCFRGVLQRILIQIFGNPWVGIVVAAALFSAFHMQFLGFLPRMMLGVLLGAAFWYSGSLWAAIFAHMFYNGIQVIIASYYPKMIDENPSVPAYLGLASLVIVVGLVRFMRRQSTVSYEEVYS